MQENQENSICPKDFYEEVSLSGVFDKLEQVFLRWESCLNGATLIIMFSIFSIYFFDKDLLPHWKIPKRLDSLLIGPRHSETANLFSSIDLFQNVSKWWNILQNFLFWNLKMRGVTFSTFLWLFDLRFCLLHFQETKNRKLLWFQI